MTPLEVAAEPHTRDSSRSEQDMEETAVLIESPNLEKDANDRSWWHRLLAGTAGVIILAVVAVALIPFLHWRAAVSSEKVCSSPPCRLSRRQCPQASTGFLSERQHRFTITDFHAVGDGATDNTAAFRSAMAALADSRVSETGGGLLLVPAGTWLTGPFNLTSNMTLFLEAGAVIKAVEDISAYPLIAQPPTYGPGRELGPGPRYHSLILGYNVTGVRITGENGTIDGSGAVWWAAVDSRTLPHTRGHVLELQNCCHVEVSNLTFVDPPFWCIHPLYSSHVALRHLTITAPSTVRQTDGIDPDSSTHVLIEDCFISTGDDAVAIKSGWDQYGAVAALPSANITVRRVAVWAPTAAGLSIGSEMSGGVEGVLIEDCTVAATGNGIRIKTGEGRCGYVRNVILRNNTVANVKYGFIINTQFGHGHPPGYDPSCLPRIELITVSGLAAINVTRPVVIYGLNGSMLRNISFKDVRATYATMDVRSRHSWARKAWTCSNCEGTYDEVDPLPAPESCSCLKG